MYNLGAPPAVVVSRGQTIGYDTAIPVRPPQPMMVPPPLPTSTGTTPTPQDYPAPGPGLPAPQAPYQPSAMVLPTQDTPVTLPGAALPDGSQLAAATVTGMPVAPNTLVVLGALVVVGWFLSRKRR